MNINKNPILVGEPLGRTSDEQESQIFNASNVIGLAKEAGSAKTVFIKPNLTYPRYKEGVTTRRDYVRSLVAVLVRLNPDLKIYIGEGEGGYNSYSMSKAFDNMGYNEIKKEFSQVEIINLSKVPSKTHTIDTLRGPYEIELPEIFFKEIDFSISCPLPKVHCMTRITLSYKNQWGCLPDTMRLKNHYMFNHLVSNISDVLKFKYVFLDGKYGLDNNGPMVGDPIEVNWFVASNSLGAFDMIVSEMMGFDWKTVKHLQTASRYGFIPKRQDVKIFGDIESLKRQFVLKREMWNYPALTAFGSKSLTHLFYFSIFAKVLHDIMYTFRKRPID